ncbi:MAG: efflux RND transporter permease subunit [Bacteroidia bacterium]|nr:efflux RND transporter permease subunit [Bacteroidia bacterium]
MLNRILDFSLKNKLIVILFTITVASFGLYAVFRIPVGAVPDITNNQVRVITTSGNLSTQEIEQFITAPVEMEMANLPGYENKYTAMDLRTIQDWMVRRRLSGINGVVEINRWGGYLKQYEIAIYPSKLKGVNITLLDVFEAISANNSISGGAYIEKTNQSFFIRGDGQVKTLDDIENIVVAYNNGFPIFN